MKLKPVCDATAQAHFLRVHFEKKNGHILMSFCTDFPPSGGKMLHLCSNCLNLTDLFPHPHPHPRPKKNKERPTNGHICVVTNLEPLYLPPPLRTDTHTHTPPTSSIPVCPPPVCLNVCFRSLSLQKQMASSLSSIQRRSGGG